MEYTDKTCSKTDFPLNITKGEIICVNNSFGFDLVLITKYKIKAIIQTKFKYEILLF